MTPEQANAIKQRVETLLNSFNQPLQIKKRLAMEKMALALPHVHTNQEARSDVDTITLYLQIIDYEIKTAQLAAANQQSNPYGQPVQNHYVGMGAVPNNNYNPMTPNGVAPSYTTSIPNNPYANASVNNNGVTNSVNVDAGVNRFEADNTVYKEPSYVDSNTSDERFGGYSNTPKQEVTEPAKTIAVNQMLVPVDGEYHDILITNDMYAEKIPIENTNFYSWDVGYDDGSDFKQSHYKFKMMTDNNGEIPYYEDNYRERLVNDFKDNPSLDFVMARVHLHRKIPVNSNLNLIDCTPTGTADDYLSLMDRVDLWKKTLSVDNDLMRYLDRKFTDIVNKCLPIFFPMSPGVLIRSYLEDTPALKEKVIELDKKSGETVKSKTMVSRLERLGEMAGSILVADVIMGGEQGVLVDLQNKLAKEEDVESGGRPVYVDNENFLAIYTNHKDFKDLYKTNNFYQMVLGKYLTKRPIRLSEKYHKGLIDMLNSVSRRSVKTLLITPDAQYEIYHSISRDQRFLFIK